ncbi:hypothetical protein QBC37DRAFT_403190 [Rhypophila decipiens]|uniref:Uncharacterized protein n=1 Tax=Rhypophila decipiens TaxID=261697 RepID=A0AAN6Y3N6_9PEZI|nr:hypothetical protein QBC37DRAFT_403190 [Rhypophila decipiens]
MWLRLRLERTNPLASFLSSPVYHVVYLRDTMVGYHKPGKRSSRIMSRGTAPFLRRPAVTAKKQLQILAGCRKLMVVVEQTASQDSIFRDHIGNTVSRVRGLPERYRRNTADYDLGNRFRSSLENVYQRLDSWQAGGCIVPACGQHMDGRGKVGELFGLDQRPSWQKPHGIWRNGFESRDSRALKAFCCARDMLNPLACQPSCYWSVRLG